MQVKCTKCDKYVSLTAKEKGPHIGLYCPVCFSYIKWANAFEKQRLTQQNEKIKTASLYGKMISNDEEDLPWNL